MTKNNKNTYIYRIMSTVDKYLKETSDYSPEDARFM